MGVVADIGRSFRHGPRGVVREHLARGPQEARTLAFLMIGCILVWVAQWPRLMREAAVNRAMDPPGAEFQQLVGTALFGWVMLLPLLFYFLAFVVHQASRLMGGRGESWGARVALFWSWLASSPLGLVTGALAGLTGPSIVTNLAGIAWIAVFAAFWTLSQREVSSGPALHAH